MHILTGRTSHHFAKAVQRQLLHCRCIPGSSGDRCPLQTADIYLWTAGNAMQVFRAREMRHRDVWGLQRVCAAALAAIIVKISLLGRLLGHVQRYVADVTSSHEHAECHQCSVCLISPCIFM